MFPAKKSLILEKQNLKGKRVMEKTESQKEGFTGQKKKYHFSFFFFYATSCYSWFFVVVQNHKNRNEAKMFCLQLCIHWIVKRFFAAWWRKCVFLFWKHGVVWRQKNKLVFRRNVNHKPTMGVMTGMAKIGSVNLLLKKK